MVHSFKQGKILILYGGLNDMGSENVNVAIRGVHSWFCGLPQWLKEVSATDWPRTKSRDISLDCHIRIYCGVIRLKIFFLESVTFQFHARNAQLTGRTVIKKFGHFSDLGDEISLSHRHVDFFGWSKYINPRPRRG